MLFEDAKKHAIQGHIRTPDMPKGYTLKLVKGEWLLFWGKGRSWMKGDDYVEQRKDQDDWQIEGA